MYCASAAPPHDFLLRRVRDIDHVVAKQIDERAEVPPFPSLAVGLDEPCGTPSVGIYLLRHRLRQISPRAYPSIAPLIAVSSASMSAPTSVPPWPMPASGLFGARR